ncbi:hypothetical protein [Microbaculum marinum]|uniref:Uncharacterized protein n=1 Tax=Microbaculum marinum TaxID=1764581 RepID=A0AAW9RWW1_9HYPH
MTDQHDIITESDVGELGDLIEAGGLTEAEAYLWLRLRTARRAGGWDYGPAVTSTSRRREVLPDRRRPPRPGDVHDGFVFVGGDPAVPSSWEAAR